MKRDEVIVEIIALGRSLYERNLLAAADGNISYRISDEEILFTPSGVPKRALSAERFATVKLDGTIQEGRPSSERRMHLAVYRNCPEARCVVHAHTPYAIAWSIAFPNDKELPSEGMSEMILAVGRIPIVPYARPSTDAMGDNLVPFLPDHRALILSRHGAVSWGESLTEAQNGIERLEHAAQILWLAKTLGGVSRLPDEELLALREMRAKLGKRSL